ncbi:MAG: glycoside hydrolase family 32 protein, partial [Chloroflexi bacterium]
MQDSKQSRFGRGRRVALFVLLPLGVFLFVGPGHGSAAGVTFNTVYVDPARGGGEPFVIYSHAAHDLVYSSHEGTTLTDSSFLSGANCDIVTDPPNNVGPDGYICSYNNQVNMWYSTDAGHTWTKSLGNPVYTGFSDPSLTEDECTSAGACNIYDTGINLANDALYASPDGGVTWAAGTPQCPPTGGDRPWLAGGKYGEVFMSSNITGGQGTHTIYHGTVTQVGGQNASLTCGTTGIADSGGQGQIYYN